MIALLLAAALQQAAPDPCNAAAAPEAGCPHWRTLQSHPDRTTFLDPASVVRENGGFGIVMRLVFSENQQTRLRSALVRYRFDCVARTSVAVHVTLFDAAGLRLHDQDLPNRAPRHEEPGTPSVALFAEFCPR